ncbi:hypothetical protein A2U01_0104464, partial [Trifolium medium]|nr:hypothetical protein [Trifolium medium]
MTKMERIKNGKDLDSKAVFGTRETAEREKEAREVCEKVCISLD